MNTVVKILICIAIIVAAFILCRITYKIIKWLAVKNIRVPQTAVRIFKLLLLLVLLAFVGYFIYTGFRL